MHLSPRRLRAGKRAITSVCVALALVLVVFMAATAKADSWGSVKDRYATRRAAELPSAIVPDTAAAGAGAMRSAFVGSSPVRAMGEDIVPSSFVEFHNETNPSQFAFRYDLKAEAGMVRRLVAVGDSRNPRALMYILAEAPQAIVEGDPSAKGEVVFRELGGLLPTKRLTISGGELVSARTTYDGMMTSYKGRQIQPNSIIGWWAGQILGQGTCTGAKWVAENWLGYRCPAWCTAWWNPWPVCAYCLLSFCAHAAG